MSRHSQKIDMPHPIRSALFEVYDRFQARYADSHPKYILLGPSQLQIVKCRSNWRPVYLWNHSSSVSQPSLYQ